jgi:putative ABC transport system permease protein
MKNAILKLSWANLTSRPLHTALAVATLASAAALVALLLLVQGHTEKRLAKDLAGVDLVVGSKGSPLQLILSSLLHLDVPTGNIPLADAQALMADPQVAHSVPIALGDSFRGFRIVGTTPEFPVLYGATLAAGQAWSRPQQVVIGATVHQKLRMQIGQRFAGAHGLSAMGSDLARHDHAPYRVVGILKPTGSILDRLILTPIDSVWAAHEAPAFEEGNHHGHKEDHNHDAAMEEQLADIATTNPDGREVTALLLQYASPAAAVRLPRAVNARAGLQAAAPAPEITRLFSLSSGITDVGKTVAGLLTLIGALSIFAALSSASADKRYDIALMRAMGAQPGFIFRQQILEGMLVAAAGALAGLALAHLAVMVAHALYEPVAAFGLTGRQMFTSELYLLLGTTLLGLAAALWPALSCYRIDPTLLLQRGR